MTTNHFSNPLNAHQDEAINSLFKLADVALNAADSFAMLNRETVRAALSDGEKHTKAILSISTPKDVVDLGASLGQPKADAATEYSQRVYEISSESAKELASVFQHQFESMNESFKSLAQKAALGFPYEGGPSLSAFTQVFDAANKAFENLNNATQQAIDTAQANVAKSSTTSRAKK